MRTFKSPGEELTFLTEPAREALLSKAPAAKLEDIPNQAGGHPKPGEGNWLSQVVLWHKPGMLRMYPLPTLVSVKDLKVFPKDTRTMALSGTSFYMYFTSSMKTGHLCISLYMTVTKKQKTHNKHLSPVNDKHVVGARKSVAVCSSHGNTF